jgi:hypothetical protein
MTTSILGATLRVPRYMLEAQAELDRSAALRLQLASDMTPLFEEARRSNERMRGLRDVAAGLAQLKAAELMVSRSAKAAERLVSRSAVDRLASLQRSYDQARAAAATVDVGRLAARLAAIAVAPSPARRTMLARAAADQASVASALADLRTMVGAATVEDARSRAVPGERAQATTFVDAVPASVAHAAAEAVTALPPARVAAAGTSDAALLEAAAEACQIAWHHLPARVLSADTLVTLRITIILFLLAELRTVALAWIDHREKAEERQAAEAAALCAGVAYVATKDVPLRENPDRTGRVLARVLPDRPFIARATSGTWLAVQAANPAGVLVAGWVNQRHTRLARPEAARQAVAACALRAAPPPRDP